LRFKKITKLIKIIKKRFKTRINKIYLRLKTQKILLFNLIK